MKRIILFSAFLFSVSAACYGQISLSGQTIDSISLKPIPFTHIYIQNTNYGTVADENGYFTLMLPGKTDLPIHFSSVGYKSVELINIPTNGRIYLVSKPLVLAPVNISAPSEVAREIVKKAFKSISKNYFKEPIVLNTFYRHYCLDNGKYGRMIEAQVDVYKKKGYGRQEDFSNNKDMFRINELRRSLDHTRLNTLMHQPMALDMALKSDIVALKQKNGNENKLVSAVLGLENFVDFRKRGFFTYFLKGKATLDGQEIYIVDFVYDGHEETNGMEGFLYSGQFQITVDDYAIIYYKTEISSLNSFVSQDVNYRKYGEKYAIFHSRTSTKHRNNSGMEHDVQIELITENLRQERDKDIKEEDITRAYLASIEYDSSFWADYMIGRPPIPEKAVNDLESTEELNSQFVKKYEFERTYSNSTEQEEDRLDSLLKKTEAPVMLYVWATWNRNSWSEYIRNSEIIHSPEFPFQIIFVSLDEDINQWINVLHGLKMDGTQIRLGPNSRFLKTNRIKELPHIMIFKNGALFQETFNSVNAVLEYLKVNAHEE